MEASKITIPAPCKESWNNMTDKDNGRFCNSCNKTVVDFTSMSLDEIKIYFSQNSDQRICGHFKTSQVNNKTPRLHKQLLRLYAYLESSISIHSFKLASLSFVTLCMGIAGCRNTVEGEKAPNSTCKDTPTTEQHLTGDTIITTLGMAMPVFDDKDSIKFKKK